MLQDQRLVMRQFADALALRRLVDSDEAYEDLVSRIAHQLPDALEVPPASGRRRDRPRRRRLASAAPSAHSRLGKVRNEDALDEVRSMCKWAGQATVSRMDRFLYGDGSAAAPWKYAAALYPTPASEHCEGGNSSAAHVTSRVGLGVEGSKAGGEAGRAESVGRAQASSIRDAGESAGGGGADGDGPGETETGVPWVLYGVVLGGVLLAAVANRKGRGCV